MECCIFILFYKRYKRIIHFYTQISLTLYKFYKKKEVEKIYNLPNEQNIILENNSNLIKDVTYSAKDINGNEYIVKAKEGRISESNKEIIFLRDIKALVILIDGSHVNIIAKYADYNLLNYDTVFKEDVTLDYLDNKLKANYLEFSLQKNLILMSENIIFNNPENIIKADVLEIDIRNKDTKIYMYNKDKKVNIKKLN